MRLIHKEYYSANATYLSDENIKEIKASMGTVLNAVNKMSKKFNISHARTLDYINNCERKQQIIRLLNFNDISGGGAEIEQEQGHEKLPSIKNLLPKKKKKKAGSSPLQTATTKPPSNIFRPSFLTL